MEIIECNQLDEAWFKARIGSIGGSAISSVVAKGKGKMRKDLLYRLAGEILSGQKYEGYSNHHMDRGVEEESAARELYSFVTDNEVRQVGLVRDSDHKHYSPDGLIEPDGILEIKSAIPSIHIERIVTDKIELNYERQIAWGLHICNRKWCDFVSYSPLVSTKPIWIKRIVRGEHLIKELNDEADKFLLELAQLVRKIREL